MTEGMIQGHSRVSGPTETPDGFPLPLTGWPLTKTPVVVKKEGVELKQYPEVFIPGQEALDEDEIRLTCIGSGNPIVRRAQAATEESAAFETGIVTKEGAVVAGVAATEDETVAGAAVITPADEEEEKE